MPTQLDARHKLLLMLLPLPPRPRPRASLRCSLYCAHFLSGREEGAKWKEDVTECLDPPMSVHGCRRRGGRIGMSLSMEQQKSDASIQWKDIRQRPFVLVVGRRDGGLHFLREARVKVLHVVVAVERRAVGRPQLPQLQLHSFIQGRLGSDCLRLGCTIMNCNVRPE